MEQNDNNTIWQRYANDIYAQIASDTDSKKALSDKPVLISIGEVHNNLGRLDGVETEQPIYDDAMAGAIVQSAALRIAAYRYDNVVLSVEYSPEDLEAIINFYKEGRLMENGKLIGNATAEPMVQSIVYALQHNIPIVATDTHRVEGSDRNNAADQQWRSQNIMSNLLDIADSYNNDVAIVHVGGANHLPDYIPNPELGTNDPHSLPSRLNDSFLVTHYNTFQLYEEARESYMNHRETLPSLRRLDIPSMITLDLRMPEDVIQLNAPDIAMLHPQNVPEYAKQAALAYGITYNNTAEYSHISELLSETAHSDIDYDKSLQNSMINNRNNNKAKVETEIGR